MCVNDMGMVETGVALVISLGISHVIMYGKNCHKTQMWYETSSYHNIHILIRKASIYAVVSWKKFAYYSSQI